MKSRAKKSILIILCLIFASSLLVSCKDEIEVLSDGYFKYIVVTKYDGFSIKDNEPVVAIVGFTASGLMQEVLEIPRELGGKPVRFIGYRDEGFLYGNYSYRVHSKKLKKVYVHDNIENTEYFESLQVAIMICSNSFTTHLATKFWSNEIYLYKSLFDGNNFSHRFFPANIVFINNYSNEVNGGYYRLDNIQAEEKIPVPPNPTRSGYEFMGWYTEPDCINAWNFDMYPTIEENTEFRLFAYWAIK